MKKLFLLLAFVLLAAPAFAVVDNSRIMGAANDEANTIVQMHDTNVPNSTAVAKPALAANNRLACSADSDCVAAQCCHAKSAVNKQYAPDCTNTACTADCTANTLDCGQGEIRCVKGICITALRNATSISIKLPETNRTKAHNMSELEDMKAEKQNELIAKFKGQTNQNSVRLAVHTLLAMEDMEGGIGKNVSAIAREFDDSVNKTFGAEEKIHKRNAILRALAGGDAKSAAVIEAEVTKNQARIQLLQQYMEQCSACTDDVKATIQQQITAMQQENTRLQNLATAEKAKKGIFGFLKKNSERETPPGK